GPRRAGAGAGHRRHGLELDRGGDPADARRGGERSRRRAPHLPVLQPAAPGRHLSPLRRRPRRDQAAAHRLQHPRPDGIQHRPEATKLPLIVYNIPGRTASNITPETLGRLSRVPNIAGVKEASGSLAQVIEVIAAAGPDFAVYAGDDILTLPIMAVGGKGVISV